MDCNIKEAIIIRLLITILVFYILKICNTKKYILIILPVILILLDLIDGVLVQYNNKYCRYNTHTFSYQINDKIADSISYIFMLYLLPKNTILNFFILYRIIGVILFYYTKNSQWLIIFFDFVKEYLIYLYFFKNNTLMLIVMILLKIVFEFVFHTYHNKNNY